MLYHTVDALNRGQYFWNTLLKLCPMPFALNQCDSAILSFEEDGLSVVVCKTENVDGLDRRLLQIREEAATDPVLEVSMTPEMDYINGNAFGAAVDEVGAAETLNMVMPQLGGTWRQMPSDMLMDQGVQHV